MRLPLSPGTGKLSPDAISGLDGAELGSLPLLADVDADLREVMSEAQPGGPVVWPQLACAVPASRGLVGLGDPAGLASPRGLSPVGKLGSCHTHGGWASKAVREASPEAEALS